jgi:hypothetical protein
MKLRGAQKRGVVKLLDLLNGGDRRELFVGGDGDVGEVTGSAFLKVEEARKEVTIRVVPRVGPGSPSRQGSWICIFKGGGGREGGHHQGGAPRRARFTEWPRVLTVRARSHIGKFETCSDGITVAN